MSILSDIVASLAPLVRDLTSDYGVHVTVYRMLETNAADESVTRSYPSADATLTNVPAFLHAARVGESQNDHSAPMRPYGLSRAEIGSASFPALAASGALPSLNLMDAIKVLDGPFAGYTYLCEADSAPDTAGVFAKVKLIAAPATVVLP